MSCAETSTAGNEASSSAADGRFCDEKRPPNHEAPPMPLPVDAPGLGAGGGLTSTMSVGACTSM